MGASKFAAPGSFANRTIIVTGRAGSIGHPLSITFARDGANVVVNDLGGNAEGGGASTQAADVVVEENLENLLTLTANIRNNP
jgi:NAD(P)-dependent dehydrogenase (short-subunit alcohol dehydrogenase family)